MRTRFLASVMLVSVLALSACGSSSSETASNTDAAVDETETVTAETGAADAAATEGAGTFNDADVTFAQNMIPHHQQAVEMAVIALDDARDASPAVKDLAQRISGAQQPEIDLMTQWLTSWGKEVMPPMGGMDHSSMGGMEGMMTAEEMSSLETASGASFDTAWMEMMVKHHEGAVAMAKAVQSGGSSPEVRVLAEKIITAQEAEIVEMNASLGK